MLSLLGVSLVFLGIELLGRPTAQQLELMHRIDISIGLIFLAEFIVRFALASDRPGYVRRYWWVLLGTIPISFPAFQALRFVRVGALLQLAQSYAHLEYEIRQK